MATNPPITIGPFANVPAPGSGVKSDWAQQISTYVSPSAWTALPLFGAWVAYGAPYQVPQYRKRGDIVEVRGLIKNGVIGTQAFTLPAGFRPPADMLSAQNSAGAYCALDDHRGRRRNTVRGVECQRVGQLPVFGNSMTDFGDYDPDDSWDANDHVVEQLQQIARRVAWIVEHRDDIAARIQRIVVDLAGIRQRIIDGDL